MTLDDKLKKLKLLNKKKASISFKLNEDLKKDLEILCKKNNVSVSSFLCVLVSSALDELKN